MHEWLLALLLRLRDSDEGQAYLEYVVLGALAVLVILASVQYFFGGISTLMERLGDTLRGL